MVPAAVPGPGECRTTGEAIGTVRRIKTRVDGIMRDTLHDPIDESTMKALADLKSLATAKDAKDLASVDWELEFMVGPAEDLGLDPSMAEASMAEKPRLH